MDKTRQEVACHGMELVFRSINLAHELEPVDKHMETLLQDRNVEWSELHSMVQREGCKLVEYSYLHNHSLAVWVVAAGIRAQKSACDCILKSHLATVADCKSGK